MQNCGKFWLIGSMLEKERKWKLVPFWGDNDLHWVRMQMVKITVRAVCEVLLYVIKFWVWYAVIAPGS